MRVSASINRFINNCRKTTGRGLLKTTEIEKQKKFWIKGEQQTFKDTGQVKIDVKSLDLQENEEGIYICKGRIEGAHPTNIYSRRTLHEEATIEMTCVRSRY